MTPHDPVALKEKLAGRRVVVSVSGGKDSASLALYMKELEIDHERVFADTSWEHPLTYEYLRGPLTEKLGPITEVRGPRGMQELVLHKGMFPSRVRRFCTQELKVFPLAAHMKKRAEELDCEIVNAVGIRAEESAARAKFTEWEFQETFDCDVWRPLLSWTLEDVVAIHKRHGLTPNPLYLKGATRVGCWPCIYARKEEVRLVADTDPARIQKIRDLESKVDEAQEARWREREREEGRASRVKATWCKVFSVSGSTEKEHAGALRSTKSSLGHEPLMAERTWRSSRQDRLTKAACAGASATQRREG